MVDTDSVLLFYAPSITNYLTLSLSSCAKTLFLDGLAGFMIGDIALELLPAEEYRTCHRTHQSFIHQHAVTSSDKLVARSFEAPPFLFEQ